MARRTTPNWPRIIAETENTPDITQNAYEALRVFQALSQLAEELHPLQVRLLELLIDGQDQKEMAAVLKTEGFTFKPMSRRHLSRLLNDLRERVKAKLN